MGPQPAIELSSFPQKPKEVKDNQEHENVQNVAHNSPSTNDSREQDEVAQPTSIPDKDKDKDEDERPKVEDSWKALLKVVEKHDQNMVGKWKDDLDTSLIFGGLFSVVAAGFTIESYRWLSEDPEDSTVTLLTQISQQLRDPNANITLPDPKAFHPDTSLVLINILWFLSLILALISGLLALLCKQWLREHAQSTWIVTQTAATEVSLRQLRRDSLGKWHVPQFIQSTSILLQGALLLFFAGIILLAWTLNSALFIVCLTICGLGAWFYIITTFLPFLTEILADARQRISGALSFRFINPYKSPQAWAMYHLCCWMIRWAIPFIGPFLEKRGYNWRTAVEPAPNWSLSDMRVLTAFDGNPPPFNINLYELRALNWATKMLQNSPSMLPHLQNIISSLSLSPLIIMTGILNYWTLAMWEEFTPEDVQEEFKDSTKFKITRHKGLGWYTTVSRAPKLDPMLVSTVGSRTLFFYQHWFHLVDNIDTTTIRELDVLYDSITRFQQLGLSESINALRNPITDFQQSGLPEDIDVLRRSMTPFQQSKLLKAIDILYDLRTHFQQPGLPEVISALQNSIEHFKQPEFQEDINAISDSMARFKEPVLLTIIDALRSLITHFEQPGLHSKRSRLLDDIDTLITGFLNDINPLHDSLTRFKQLGRLKVMDVLRNSISHFQQLEFPEAIVSSGVIRTPRFRKRVSFC
ncbi:hypothetical protein WG66_012389 [Moniliophthora roreri]|nr:hypothetical protein WG66_012389 [Moniliophthora roreri]